IKFFYTIPTTVEEIKHSDQKLLKSFFEFLDVGDTPRSYPKTKEEVMASPCHPQCRVFNNEFLYTIDAHMKRKTQDQEVMVSNAVTAPQTPRHGDGKPPAIVAPGP
ncbi:MAG: hypothetical protein KA998_05635, partial [Rickettsiaceae bacterium]|nr:hypothetical protein [Rickettsiaceae bacterium]